MSDSDNDIPESDAIADTVYSKSWVIGTLLKTVQFVQSEQTISAESSDDSLPSTNFTEIEELLCNLWDISSNEHVQQTLFSHNAHQILMNCTLETNSSRLGEICIGILANMVHNEEICQSVFGDNTFCTNVISWLSSSDIPFLTQLIRFLNMMIYKRPEVVHGIVEQNLSQFVQDIQNLLKNCLNVDTLNLLFKFINQLLYSSNDIGTQWLREDTENNCISALCQACFQVIASFDIPDSYGSHEEWTSVSKDNVDFYHHFWFITRMLYEPEFFETKFQPNLNDLVEIFHRYDYFMSDSTNAYLSYSAACAFFLLIFNSLENNDLNEPNPESSLKMKLSNDNLIKSSHCKIFKECQNNESAEEVLSVVQEFGRIFSPTN